ncbi:E3 SUMO-protein ligase RanBP2-like isoform X2 [Lineus longissimus]|uniref:E3 SUMO-protein ligase RanBP2-like isoform X2 n=1 Tax=Lineus longissimus TaxID=88925 RepID=UPI00315DDB5F
MYKTKQQVDKHVSNILGRIKDENGRLQRGFSVAKMYFEIKEYELAKRYLYGFLTVKDTLPEAHKLMGQVQEATGATGPALIAYRRSLELDGKQKDVVIKVCELYSKTDVDPDRARYWAEQAEKVSPNHEVVFKLRERVISSGTDMIGNTKDLEDLISSELLKRPHDVNLRIKLLKLFIDQEHVDEAYEHAMAVEKTSAYSTSLEWYQFLIQVLEVYQEEIGRNINSTFHRNMLHALNNVVTLTMKLKGVGDSTEALHKFDQHLQLAMTITSNSKEWEPFLNEMRAQLFYHFGTLLLKKPQKDHFDWGTATGQAAACFVVSYGLEAPDPRSAWFVSASGDDQKLYRQWCNTGAFRLSQVGHMLLTLCRGDNLMKWMNAVKQEMCTQQGREGIYDALFALRHMKLAKRTSFLMLSPLFTEVNVRFPSIRLLQQYDKVAHRIHPECLSTLVWIALQYYSGKEVTQPNYHFTIFESLQYDCPTLETSSAESLCVLDTEAFLYATIWTAAMKQLERLERVPLVDHQPHMLPLALCEPLCSKAQAEWWRTAYRLYSNTAKENLVKMRLSLQRGLEVIRMLGNHGLDVSLVVHLARTFEEMATELKIQAITNDCAALEMERLHSRARLFWCKGVEMLERLNKNLRLRHPKERLFPGTETTVDPNLIKDYVRNGKFFLACDAMTSGRHEEAIGVFEELNMPYASYHQAHVYIQLADIQFDGRSGGELTSDVRTKCSALLTKAKESFYLTMDRIRGDKHHKFHQLLPNEIDEVENRILVLEEYDEPDLSTSQLNNSMMNGTDSRLQNGASFIHSTPRPPLRLIKMENSTFGSPESRHIQPSPERLDAQIRSMQSTQEKVMKDVMECNKSLLETNRVLASELKENRVTMQQMKAKLDELARNSNRGPVPPPAPMPPPTVPLTYYTPDILAYAPGGGFMPHGFPPFDPTGRLPPNFTAPPPQGQHIPTVPLQTHGHGHVIDEEEDYGDDCYDGEDDYASENQSSQFPVTSLEGKSTVTYTPQGPMPGPGFFSHGPVGASPGFSGSAGLSGPPPIQHFPSPVAVSGPSITMGTSNAGQFMTRPPVSGPPPNAVLGTPLGPRPGFPVSSQSQVGSNFEYPVPLLAAGPAPTSQGANSNLVSMIAAKTGPPMFAKPSGDAGVPVVQEKNLSYPTEGDKDPSYSEPHYEPIMALPEEVVKTTGEEDETILYQNDRARMYRFSEGQWKERGTGPVKILKHKTNGKVRLLMRREQVLKICANHFFHGGMTISSMKAAKNAYMWFAQDFAEEQVKNEQFALKFKTEEMATDFKEKFLEAVQLAEGNPKEPGTQVTKLPVVSTAAKTAEKSPAAVTSTATSSFKFGSAAFGVAKDDLGANTEKTSMSQSGFKFGENGGGFKFGSSTPVAMFGQKEASPAPKAVGSASPASSLLSEMATKHQEEAKQPQVSTTDGKIHLGGFSFTAPPKLKPADEEPPIAHAHAGKPKAETTPAITDAPKPFAGFSFGSKSSPFTSLVLGSGEKEKEKASASPILGGKKELLSFADLSKQATSTPVATALPSNKPASADLSKKATSTPSFVKPAENAASPEKPHDKSTEESHPEGYVPTVDYQPIIQLPQLVEVQTGEEEEKKLFGERAKLYRYDPDTRQWKERGIGEMKIMKNSSTGRSRILMRREQVLKLCANHIITTDMSLVEMKGSKNAWCWTANDFSEEDHKVEKLAVKFKTETVAAQFKEIFEECQDEALGAGDEDEEVPEDLSMKATAKPPSDLYALLRPAEGSWSCDSCMLPNGPDTTQCVACLTPKPGTQVAEAKPVFLIGGATGFTFGSSPGGKPSSGFAFGSRPESSSVKPAEDNATAVKPFTSEELAAKFKIAPGSWTCDACYLSNGPHKTKCLACETPKPGCEQSNSGAQGTNASPQIGLFNPNTGGGFTVSGGKGGFVFASKSTPATEPAATQASGFGFGSKPVSAMEPVTSTQSIGFTFGSKTAPEQSTQATGFKFGSKPAVEVTSTEPGAAGAVSEDPLDKLRMKDGEWECDMCMIKNKAGSTKCAACTSPKPGTAVAPDSSTPAWLGASGATGFSMPSQSSSPGGFAFGSNPEVEEKKTEPSAGGFKFGQTSTPKSASSLTSGFNFGSAASSFKFGSTPESSSTPPTPPEPKTPEFKFGSSKTFAFTGVTPSAGSTSMSNIRSPKSPDDHYHSEEDDSHIHFEPIIPLPEKIEVKTGEEDETTLFTHRAKLYRWQKEWKERGVGNISILQHKENGRIRVIMRREQVLKLCCNHNITGEIKLTPMEKANGKAYLWYAMDCAEGEPKAEKLCVRFKTAEIAGDFAKVFNDSVEKMKGFKSPQKSGAHETDASKADTSVANSSTASDFSFKIDNDSIKDSKMPAGFSFKSPEQTSKSNFSFGDRFNSSATGASPLNKSKEVTEAAGDAGSDSDVEIIYEELPTPEQIAMAEKYQLPRCFYLYEKKPDCPGCRGCVENWDQLQYDDHVDDVQVISELKASKHDQERAKKYQLPDNFYLYEQKPPCSGCPGCESCSPMKDSAGSAATKSADTSSQEPDSTIDTADSKAGILTSSEKPVLSSSGIGMSGLGMSFADVAGSLPASGFAFGNQDKSKSFSWTGAGKTLFSKVSKSADDTGDDGEVVQGDDVHYDAIMPLPELVEVKTGTEDEEPVYSQRAKVFRYDPGTKQWKERGVGEMKILKHKTQVQYRLLMRREQVLKLACNHLMTTTMELTRMTTSETAWCWFAIDYSTNEASHDQLAVRFKTIMLAKQFQQAFLECQQHLRDAEKSKAEEEAAVSAGADSSEIEDDADAQVPTCVQEVAEADDQDGGDRYEDYEDEDEVEEEDVMFEKKATLFSKELNEWKKLCIGDLLVVYDEEVYGARIQMDNPDGETICSHHIAIETQLTPNEKKKTCEWAATDFSAGEPIRRQFKAQFSNVPAVKEFQQIFKQGVEFAQAANISELDVLTIPTELDVPEVVGQGRDVEDDAPQPQAGGRAPLAARMFMPVLKIMLFVSVVMNSAQSTSGYGFDSPTNLPALLPTHFLTSDTAGYLDMLARDPQKLLEVVGIFHPEMLSKKCVGKVLAKPGGESHLCESHEHQGGVSAGLSGLLSHHVIESQAFSMPTGSSDSDVDNTPPSPFRRILDKEFWEIECKCALHRVNFKLRAIQTGQSATSIQTDQSATSIQTDQSSTSIHTDQSASCTQVSGGAPNVALGEIKSCSPELSAAVQDLITTIQQGSSGVQQTQNTDVTSSTDQDQRYMYEAQD